MLMVAGNVERQFDASEDIKGMASQASNDPRQMKMVVPVSKNSSSSQL